MELTQEQQRVVLDAILDFGPLFEIAGNKINRISDTGLASTIINSLYHYETTDTPTKG